MVHKSPFTDVRLSHSGKYLLAGTVDGMTCIRKLKLEDMLLFNWTKGHETYAMYSKDFEAESASVPGQGANDENGQYWFGHVHNCDSGRINTITMTFDDSFLCSAGNDGGLFIWRFEKEHIKKSEGNLIVISTMILIFRKSS